MDLYERKNEIKAYNHRFTPQKYHLSDIENKEFSFCDWKKVNIKRSPSTIDYHERPKIKEFYNKEQKKLLNIHKSFDSRRVNNWPLVSKVDKMNFYIKFLINEHNVLKKRVAIQDEMIKNMKNETFCTSSTYKY